MTGTPSSRTRPLGRTGASVLEVGYGAWGIGHRWWGGADDAESERSIRLASDLGVNFFDTAYVYGDGHSETIVGRALQGREAIIATKVPPKNDSWPAKAGSNPDESFPAEWIRSCTERSLAKLGRDRIDLQQLHVWTDDWLGHGEWLRAIEDLKRAGKVRWVGVSINDHAPDTALNLVASGLIDTVQVIFNIFDQSPIKNLFPLCLKHNVGVIVRVPFDEGGLTGTLTRDTVFEGDDFRKHYFRGERLGQVVDRAEKLKALLGPEAATLPELALKFILSHEAVSVVIPGMRKERNVRANVATAGGRLSADLLSGLRGHAWPRNFYGWWS